MRMTRVMKLARKIKPLLSSSVALKSQEPPLREKVEEELQIKTCHNNSSYKMTLYSMK